MMRVSAELMTDCQLWWAKFIYEVTLRFLSALGLPVTPGNIINRIYNMLIDEPSVNIALDLMIEGMKSSPIKTVTLAFGVLSATYQAGLLWPIMKLGFSLVSWWAMAWALKQVVELILVPEAEVADLMVGLTQWALGLILHRQQFPTVCPVT